MEEESNTQRNDKSILQKNTMQQGSKWEFLENSRRKTRESQCLHRDGPAPRSGTKKNGAQVLNGSLDSDVEDGGKKNPDNETRQGSTAGSKAFIIYFAKLAHASDNELVDFDFVESLLDGGACVNSTDKHGQTVIHEVARNWHPDVAFFLLQHGAEINRADKWGRTPLHSASAVDHADMIEFLLRNGADIDAKTLGERQSPIHYAAKFNSVRALKVLIDMKANVNDRDYKGRTPLFAAAEAAREDAARYLVERGAPAGVFDESGLSAIALMIEKMPKVAKDALEQFIHIDRAFRKEQCYLNYLEADPANWKDYEDFRQYKKEKRREGVKVSLCPTTPLKVAVQCHELEILMHPVIQHLIAVKWKLFGKWGSIFAAGFHLTYILIWTWLAIFLPRDGIYYTPASKFWWRMVLEILGCLMTLYFIFKQIWEVKSTRKDQQKYQFWRVRELERDLEFCHPRWSEESQYLESEIGRVRSSQTGYFKDAWNIMDWLTYIAVLSVIVTRALAVFSNEQLAKTIHPRAYAVALIFMWLHFMKSCRPFTSLGPFIAMLGHVMQDTLRFTFLFFEFFIPYLCAFWIIFGGHENAEIMTKDGQDPIAWKKFNDLTYSVWMVTLIADFNFDALIAVDRLMAQVLVGTYFAIASVVCLNLYIALLSDTFARVYQNAKANAALLQATTILQIEKALSEKRRSNAEKYIQKSCSPLEVTLTSGHDGDDDASGFNRLVRQVNSRLESFEDVLKDSVRRDDDANTGNHNLGSKINTTDGRQPKRAEMPFMADLMLRDQQIQVMRRELRAIHDIVLNFLSNTKPNLTYELASKNLQPAREAVVPHSKNSSKRHQQRRNTDPDLARHSVSRIHQPSRAAVMPQIKPKNPSTPKKKQRIPDIIENEDVMRDILNKKLNAGEQFPGNRAPKSRKKKRRRKEKKSEDGEVRSECLSESWEEVWELGAESVC